MKYNPATPTDRSNAISTIGFAPSPAAAGILLAMAAAELLAELPELPVELPLEPDEPVEDELLEFIAKDWYASKVLAPLSGLLIISLITAVIVYH